MKKMYLSVMIFVSACIFLSANGMSRRGLQTLGEYVTPAKEAAKRYLGEEANVLKQEAKILEEQANVLKQEADVARQQAQLTESAAAGVARGPSTQAGVSRLRIMEQQPSAGIGRAAEAFKGLKNDFTDVQENVQPQVQRQKTMFSGIQKEKTKGLGDIVKINLEEQIAKIKSNIDYYGKSGQDIAANIAKLRAEKANATTEAARDAFEMEITREQDSLVYYSRLYLEQLDKLKRLEQQLLSNQ